MKKTYDKLSEAKFFSKIDFCQGYHQIRLDEVSNLFIAFKTRCSPLKFSHFAFGLPNAPATFNPYINGILLDYPDNIVILYIEHILICRKTYAAHIEDPQKILSTYRRETFYPKLSKCALGSSFFEYLGHVISSTRILVKSEKIKTIDNWPIPTNKEAVPSFLELVNYYRRFIRSCSSITKPFTEVTRIATLMEF